MSNSVFVTLVVVVAAIGFLLGFTISKDTGVEPGFFEIAEAGGYGAGSASAVPEGLSEDLADYYSDLAK